MASAHWQVQSEDSESCRLLGPEQFEEAQESQYGTCTGSTGSATELRFIMLGGNDDVMDLACDIILRKRAERADSGIRHRESHVCGRKISVVKTPSIWMNDVASCCCFDSKEKSIKDQMMNYTSLVFPGPHAFLLVTDNRTFSGREQYPLKAIAKVFGKEALDYTMVLIIGRTEPKGIDNVRKFVRKFYTLEDTEQSVVSLFKETEIMTQCKKPTFFIQSSYENLMKKAFLSWEKEKYDEIRRETEKPLKEKIVTINEQHTKEVTELKEKLRITLSEIADKEKQHSQKITEFTETSKITENNLKKDMHNLKCLIMNTLIHLKSTDSEQKDEPGASITHESLNQELEACVDSQSLINIFSSIADGYIHRENVLKKKLKDSELEKNCLRTMYSSMIDDCIQIESLKKDNEELQKEVEQLKTIETELKQLLREAKDKEELKQVETDLARREADMNRRKNELEAKKREMAEKETQTRGSESEPQTTICSDDERGESREEDSQASVSHESDFGGFNPVRRNSKDLDPPSMSGSDHRPLDTL